MACADTPLRVPRIPVVSVVVALTETHSGAMPIASAIAARMASIWGRSGALHGYRAVYVADGASLRRRAGPLPARQRSSESMPLNSSEVSGKSLPMSPSAAAPSRASHTACIATSPSEWATRPFVWSTLTPPSHEGQPLGQRVDVETVSDSEFCFHIRQIYDQK